MRKSWLGMTTVLAGVLLAGTAQAAVIYEDNFDEDGLGVNTSGVGGGLQSNVIRQHSWDDTGVLQFVTSANTHYQNRAIAYTENGFQSTEGFELTVDYFWTSDGGASALSFGLVGDDTDLSTYSGFHPFSGDSSVYSIGVNANNGNFAFTDGSSVTNLDNASSLLGPSTSKDFVVVLYIVPDGLGGADCSWSIDGANQGTNNIAVFDFNKTFRFVAYGQDDQGDKGINSVSLNALGNAAPIADSQQVKVYPDTAWDITLTGFDPEGGSLSYTIVDHPTNGTLDVSSIPNVIYTPNAGFEGADGFTFIVNDGGLDSDLATVSITVAPNDAPIADSQSVQTLPDTALGITLSGSDTDGPSNLTYTVVGSPTNGMLSGTAPDLVYTPDSGFAGTDGLTFKVFDGLDESALATVSISVSNELPVATAQSLAVSPGSTLAITLSGSDTDGPSNLTYAVLSNPVHGMLATNVALPDLTYTADAGYEGLDSFTFLVNDGLADSAPATITISVTNYVPRANSQQVILEYGTNAVITLSGNDPEGSNLTYAVSAPAHGTLSGTAPTLTYTPDANHEGADGFTFTVSDGVRSSDPATVRIWVEPAGVNLSFTDLGTGLATSNNTLKVGGSTSNLVVEGVASGNDYIYSVTYTGADFDGDAVNDTLTFDVRVEALNGSTASTTFIASDTDVNAYKGSAAIGTNDVSVTLNANGWAVADGLMQAGETLALTVQNLSVSASQSLTLASLNRFTGVTYRETNNSYGHQVVIGEGASALFATRFNATQYAINGVLAESNPLYVTSADLGGVPSSFALRWNLYLADFSINIKPGGVPDVALGVSGGNLVFSWEGNVSYDVLTNANLVYPKWGVAIPGATSPSTNAIGSEPQLFFKLSE
ncbi:Ig-like domain-containing protein [Pontiella sp.]|uniref:Ig-like domain-containing protein n=1 Tax=Pontiella sp. TaxID=2837462 RepID=UPI0035620F68